MQQTLHKQAKPAADAESSLSICSKGDRGIFHIPSAKHVGFIKENRPKNTGEKEAISTHNFKFGSTSEAGQGWLLLTSSWLLAGN